MKVITVPAGTTPSAADYREADVLIVGKVVLKDRAGRARRELTAVEYRELLRGADVVRR